MNTYFVYILSSHSRTLYIPMTNDLERRIPEHKHGLVPGFTAKYNVNRLVYYEEFPDPNEATARERQLKGWRRSKKVALIERFDPGWHDISAGWSSET
ncbi:MAG: GIY-YIG nuclease family protein [Thermomicrobiales bacterium]